MHGVRPTLHDGRRGRALDQEGLGECEWRDTWGDGRAGPAVELLGGDGSLRRSMRSCEEAHFRLVSAPAAASITWNRRRGDSSGQTAPPVLRCDDELAPATRGLARSAGEQQACRARARAAVSLRRQSRPHVEQRGLQHPSSPKDGDPTLRFWHASFFQTDPPLKKVRRGLYSPEQGCGRQVGSGIVHPLVAAIESRQSERHTPCGHACGPPAARLDFHPRRLRRRHWSEPRSRRRHREGVCD